VHDKKETAECEAEIPKYSMAMAATKCLPNFHITFQKWFTTAINTLKTMATLL
jgi:hypothetical protein